MGKSDKFKKNILENIQHTNPKKKNKRHFRSLSFTSNSSLHSLQNDATEKDDEMMTNGNGSNANKGRFDGLKAQELIDAIYDRKVEMLNDQILRMQQEIKKKDSKLTEYNNINLNRKREIQLLEKELNETRIKYKVSDTQNITMYRDQVRKLTQTNDSLKKALQTAHDSLKSAELKRTDIQDEYKQINQNINSLQQKVQRVLQQNNTITNQVEQLHAILNHQKYDHLYAAHNHLDTIRKCNMRGIQILHEIIEKNKNRRKRSNILISNDTQNNEQEYQRYHSTKSTRFSSTKNRKNKHEQFEFDSYSTPKHHHQTSQNMQSLVLTSNTNKNEYNPRMKRVSYDYVDGGHSMQKYKDSKKKLYSSFDHHSFDEMKRINMLETCNMHKNRSSVQEIMNII